MINYCVEISDNASDHSMSYLPADDSQNVSPNLTNSDSSISSVQSVFYFEGLCYLKSKKDALKKHWVVIDGLDLYFFKQKGDEKPRVFHVLMGTFPYEMP